jgi:hypothetical protein
MGHAPAWNLYAERFYSRLSLRPCLLNVLRLVRAGKIAVLFNVPEKAALNLKSSARVARAGAVNRFPGLADGIDDFR